MGFEESLARGADYLQIDMDKVRLALRRRLESMGVVLMETRRALEELEWVRDYSWRIAEVDEYAREAMGEERGTLIYVPPGVKVREPVQTCFLVSREGVEQAVHNIIVVDEGAELTLNTVCAAMVGESLHTGVSEIYVKRGGRLVYAMVHGWNQRFDTHPRTAVLVDEGAELIMNYVSLRPVRRIDSNPKIRLGEGARAYYSSIVLGLGDSEMDLGTTVVLEGRGSGAEVVSRGVIRDRAHATLRGELVARAPDVRGHLECKALQLSEGSLVRTVPILRSEVGGAQLTHEAAVGRVSEEELEYLASRGFTEAEATSFIVRGFVETGIERMPDVLRPQLEVLLELVARKAVG